MKRRSILVSGISIIMASTVLLTGCGSKDNKIKLIQESGVLNVAVPELDSAYLEYDEGSGEYTGTDAELVELIASQLGVNVKYLAANQGTYTSMLSTGQADIAIGTIQKDSNIAAGYACTKEYGTDFVYVITKRGLYPGNLNVFDGQNIGYAANLDKLSSDQLGYIVDVTVNEYSNLADAIEDLKNDAITGFFCNRLDAYKYVGNQEFQVQNIHGLEKEEYVILTNPENQKLIDGMNIVIDQYLTSLQEAAVEEAESEEGETSEESTEEIVDDGWEE